MSDPAFLFRRRHPDYLKHEAVWRHCADACRGGSDYLEKTLIRHVSEIDIEFSERKRRAYYFNYPRNIASRITQQVMAVSPVRSGADPALVEDWSRTGLRTNEVIRQLSNMLTVYGTAWIQIDAPCFQQPVSRKQAAAENLRPYVKLLSPLEVTDYAYGDDGKLEWALIREERYDSPDPFCEGSFWENIKLLRRGQWQSFSRRCGVICENGSGPLPGEELPLFKVTENEGVRSESIHWFEDMVRISEAIFNNESESQMNMVKQMFGLLWFPKVSPGAPCPNCKERTQVLPPPSPVPPPSSKPWKKKASAAISALQAFPAPCSGRKMKRSNGNFLNWRG